MIGWMMMNKVEKGEEDGGWRMTTEQSLAGIEWSTKKESTKKH